MIVSKNRTRTRPHTATTAKMNVITSWIKKKPMFWSIFPQWNLKFLISFNLLTVEWHLPCKPSYNPPFFLPSTPSCLAASHHLLNWDPVSMTTSHRRGLPSGGRVYQSCWHRGSKPAHAASRPGWNGRNGQERACMYLSLHLRRCQENPPRSRRVLFGVGLQKRGTVCVAESLILKMWINKIFCSGRCCRWQHAW